MRKKVKEAYHTQYTGSTILVSVEINLQAASDCEYVQTLKQTCTHGVKKQLHKSIIGNQNKNYDRQRSIDSNICDLM